MSNDLGVVRDERTAVDKAFSILKAFGADSRGALGVSEIARRTGLSKSTSFRLLSMLEHNQVVTRVGTGYRVGSLLSSIGSSGLSPAHDALRDALTPYLIDLYERTRQTVHLAVLEGTEIVYLNKLHGSHPAHSPSRIGGHAPAYATGIGKVLLAWNPESTDQTLSSPLEAWTENTIVDKDRLLVELDGIRRTGVGFDRGESLRGLSCIAAPIVGRSGRPVAAFSISMDGRASAPESYAHTLRTVCYAASQAFRTRAGHVSAATA